MKYTHKKNSTNISATTRAMLGELRTKKGSMHIPITSLGKTSLSSVRGTITTEAKKLNIKASVHHDRPADMLIVTIK